MPMLFLWPILESIEDFSQSKLYMPLLYETFLQIIEACHSIFTQIMK